MMAQNYYTLIEKIVEAYTRQGRVRHWEFGLEDEIDLDKQVVYPLLHIVPQPSTIADNIVTYGFRAIVLDRIDDGTDIDKREETTPENRVDNMVDIFADTAHIHSLAIGYLSRGLPNTYRVATPNVITPVTGGGKNNLGGWGIDFTIDIPNADVTDGGVC